MALTPAQENAKVMKHQNIRFFTVINESIHGNIRSKILINSAKELRALIYQIEYVFLSSVYVWILSVKYIDQPSDASTLD